MARKKAEISISFPGQPGDAKDELVQSIFKKFRGDIVGAGSFLGKKPERDMQCHVPADKASECVKELKKAGFKNACVAE